VDNTSGKITIATAYRWEGYLDKLENSHRVLRKKPGAGEKEVKIPENLYLKFAALEATEESFLQFAHKFGPLGVTFYVYPTNQKMVNSLQSPIQMIKDTFNDWKEQLLKINCRIELLNACKPPHDDKKYKSIHEMIIKKDGDYYYTNNKMPSSKIRCIEEKISFPKVLQDKLITNSLYLASWHFADSIRERQYNTRWLFYNPMNRRFEWRKHSLDLYEIIHNQFALTICRENNAPLLCEWCEKPIEDAKYSNRRFHKGNCQKRHSRQQIKSRTVNGLKQLWDEYNGQTTTPPDG